MDLLTIEQARQRLGISDATIRRWLRAGRLEAQLINHRYYFRDQDINRLLSEQNREDDYAVTRQQIKNLELLISSLDHEMYKLRSRVEQLEQGLERIERLLERPVRAERQSISPKQTPRASVSVETNTALPDELPPGSLHIQAFLEQHNLKQHRRKIVNYLDAPSNGLHYEAFPGRTEREKERYLTPEQQEKLLEWLRERHSELLSVYM